MDAKSLLRALVISIVAQSGSAGTKDPLGRHPGREKLPGRDAYQSPNEEGERSGQNSPTGYLDSEKRLFFRNLY
jgi:hypothetical protein